MRSEVLTEMKISMLIFLVVTPCRLVYIYRETFRRHILYLTSGLKTQVNVFLVLKKEAIFCSYTSKSTRRYNPEDQHPHYLYVLTFHYNLLLCCLLQKSLQKYLTEITTFVPHRVLIGDHETRKQNHTKSVRPSD